MKKFVSSLVIFGLFGVFVCGLLLVNFGKAKDQQSHAAGSLESGFWTYNITNANDLNTTVRTESGRLSTGTGSDLTDNLPQKFKLTANIDLSGIANWTPISLLAGRNILDGQGFTISGLKITSTGSGMGLFGNLNGTVENVNFTNYSIAAGALRGVVAGTVVGAASSTVVDAKIKNVTIEAGTLSNNRTGGLVGSVGLTINNTNGPQISATLCKLSITNCVNKASTTTASDGTGSGGLIGYVYNSTVNVYGSVNQGNFTIGNKSTAGGIIGTVVGSGGSLGSAVKVEYCYNTGNFTLSQGQGNLGGIIGATSGAGNSISVSNCANNGTLPLGGGSSTNPGIAPPGYVDPNPEGTPGGSNNSSTGSGTGSGSAPTDVEDKIVDIEEVITGKTSIAVEHTQGTGYTFSGTQSVYSGDPYTFTVSLLSGYTNVPPTVEVKNSLGGSVAFTGPTRDGATNTYSCTVTGAALEAIAADSSLTNKITIVVSATINEYTIKSTRGSAPSITGGDGFEFVGMDAAFFTTGIKRNHGTSFAFAVEVSSNHNQQAPAVTSVSGTTFTGTRRTGTNIYDYNIPSATASLDINVVPAANNYTITIPAGSNALGFLVTDGTGGKANPYTYGNGAFGFTVNFLASHENYSVKMNGVEFAKVGGGALTSGDNIFSIPQSSINGNITITISATVKEYSITNTTPATGFIYSAPATITHGSPITVTITLDASNSDSAVKVYRSDDAAGTTNKIELTSPSVNGLVYTYNIASVTKDIYIIVEGVNENSYSVTLTKSTGIDDLTGAASVLYTDTNGSTSFYTFIVDRASTHNISDPIINITGGYTATKLADRTGLSANQIKYQINQAIRSNFTITVTGVINSYTVNYSGSNYTVAASTLPSSVQHSNGFTFTVVTASPYNTRTPQVSVGTCISESNGTYTYSVTWAQIQTALGANTSFTIAITPQINQYLVAMPTGTGFTATGNANVLHSSTTDTDDYTLTITVANHYSPATVAISVTNGTLVGGQLTTGDSRIAGQVVTFKISNIVGNLSFAVTVQPNIYNVSYSSSGSGHTVDGSNQATYNTSFEFYVSLAEGYEFVGNGVSVDNGSVTAWGTAQLFPEGYLFTVTGFTSDFEITVETQIKRFTLTYVIPNDGSISSQDISHASGTQLPWGTEITINLYPTLDPQNGNYTITHIIITGENGIPVEQSLGLAQGTPLLNKKITLYENTRIEFRLVQGAPEIRTITAPASQTGYTFGGATTVLYNTSYTFTITLAAAYSNSNFTVTAAGYTLYSSSVTPAGRIYTFTINNVTQDLTFSVTGVVENSFNYLINGNSGLANDTTGTGFTITNKSVSAQGVEGAGTVNHAGTLYFTVNLGAAYNQNAPTVGITGGTLTFISSSNGSYNYSVAGIVNDITITVSATPNTYNITLPASGDGWTTSTSDSLTKGWNGTFVFMVWMEDSHYNAANPVPPTINGAEFIGDGIDNGKHYFEFQISNIQSHINIEIQATRNSYTITLPTGTGYSRSAGIDGTSRQHGDTLIFSITLLPGYTNSTIAVKNGLTDITSSASVSGSTYTFTLTVTAAVSISVTGVTPNNYAVIYPSTRTGYTMVGPDGTTDAPGQATFGQDYAFTITPTGSHDLVVSATVGGVAVTYTKNGNVYTIDKAKIDGTVEITVTSTIKTYTVNINGTGKGTNFTVSQPATVTHGSGINFSVTTISPYNLEEPDVRISGAGAAMTAGNRTGNTYEYSMTWAEIAAALSGGTSFTITVTVTLNEYTVQFPSSVSRVGYRINGTGGQTTFEHGNNYSFTVELDSSHRFTAPTVTVNGYAFSEITGSGYTSKNGLLYTFALTSAQILSSSKILVDADGIMRITVAVAENIYTIHSFKNESGVEVWEDSRLKVESSGTQVTHTVGSFEFSVILDPIFQGTAPEVILSVDGINPTSAIQAVQKGAAVNGRYTYTIDVTSSVWTSKDIWIYQIGTAEILRAYFYSNNSKLPAGEVQTIDGIENQVLSHDLITNPSIPGWELTGWNTQADGKGTSLAKNWAEGAFTMWVGAKYYAQWKYAVYNLNANAADPNPDPIPENRLQLTSVKSQSSKVSIGDDNRLDATIPLDAGVPKTGIIRWWVVKGGLKYELKNIAGNPLTGVSINLDQVIDETFIATYVIDDLIEIFASFEAGQTFNVTANIINGEYGSAKISYTDGTNITAALNNGVPVAILATADNIKLEITANAHYTYNVVGWTNLGPTDKLTGDVEITITFTPKEYALSINVESGKTLSRAPEVDAPATFKLESTLGGASRYILTVQIKNLKVLKEEAGYNFEAFVFINQDGSKTFIPPHTAGVLVLPVDSNFLTSFLHNNSELVIEMQFSNTRNVSLAYDTSKFSASVYTVTYDQYDEEVLLRAEETAAGSKSYWLPVNTRVAVGVKPDQYLVPLISGFTIENEELRNGVYYFYFTVDSESLDQIDLTINFRNMSYTFDVEQRIDNVFEAAVRTSSGLEFLTLNFGGNALADIDGLFFFAGWFFDVNGVRKPVPANLIDASNNILGFTIDPVADADFINEYASTGNRFVIFADYGDEMVLRIFVTNRAGGINGADVKVNNGTTERITSNTSIQLAAGDIVEITPMPSAYFTADFTTETFTMASSQSRTFNFTPKALAYSAASTSANGELEIQINGKTATAGSTIKYGDTITFSFNTGSMHELKKLTISNGTKTLEIENGRPFVVDAEWLDNWLVSSTLNLSFDLVADTALSTMIVVGLGATGVIVPLATILIVLYMIALKKKKKDYMHALSVQKQTESGFKTVDVFKKVTEGDL